MVKLMAVFTPTVPTYPVQHKFWGWTQHIYLDDHTEIARAHIVKGGFCSKHFHEHKTNRFHIINGSLLITVYRNDREEKVLLHPGVTLDVPPGIIHRMTCFETCDFIEIYWPNPGERLDPGDIKRLDDGGKDNNIDIDEFFTSQYNGNNYISAR